MRDLRSAYRSDEGGCTWDLWMCRARRDLTCALRLVHPYFFSLVLEVTTKVIRKRTKP